MLHFSITLRVIVARASQVICEHFRTADKFESHFELLMVKLGVESLV